MRVVQHRNRLPGAEPPSKETFKVRLVRALSKLVRALLQVVLPHCKVLGVNDL